MSIRSIRGYIYRTVMKIAHHYNWHYAPPIYPEDDIQLWCKWCGFRQTIYKAKHKSQLHQQGDDQPVHVEDE